MTNSQSDVRSAAADGPAMASADEDPLVDGPLHDFARLLFAERGEPRVGPDRLVNVVSRIVPNAVYTSLTLINRNGRPRTVASDGELPVQVDELQYELGEGPCLDAIEQDDLVRTDDLTAESRWPRFGPRAAAEGGVHSMFGVRLAVSGDERAGLNFYAFERGAFTTRDLSTGALFAPFVGLSLDLALERDRSSNLEVALESNRKIGVAVGILMSSRLLTADQALEELRAASQHLHRKLRDIAVEVAETGELPSRHPRRSRG